MMHRCSSSQGNMVGPCSCGLFHHSQSNSFSMLFSMPNNYNQYRSFDEPSDMYPCSPFTSSSVDCTLSLGTPSTRLCEDDERRAGGGRHERRPSSSCMSNFCWDILQTKNNNNTSQYGSHNNHNNKTSRGGSNSNGSSNSMANNDPLLARRCANCDTTSTPLWRNGPRGPKSLCNACGIRFKKEERRATAANANSTSTNGNPSSGAMDHHHHQHYGGYQNNSWVQSQKMAFFSPAAANEFRFIDDNDRDSDTAIPFLSWRLNVTDRPSLVHDFTR